MKIEQQERSTKHKDMFETDLDNSELREYYSTKVKEAKSNARS